jgi:predicted peptidase
VIGKRDSLAKALPCLFFGRRSKLKRASIAALCALGWFGTAYAEENQYPFTIISEVKEANTRVTAVAVDFGKDLPLNWSLKSAFSVSTELQAVNSYSGQAIANSAVPRSRRTIVKAYTSDKPQIGSPRQGRYVVIELDSADFNASSWYVGFNPGFRQLLPYGDKMVYDIDLLHDLQYFSPNVSKTEASSEISLVSEASRFSRAGAVIASADSFTQGVFALANNTAIEEISYNFHAPPASDGKKAPLVVFLHGSGQSHDTTNHAKSISADTLSPLLTNQGGVVWLERAGEPTYVLVPQAPARDLVDENSKGGWTSKDTQALLLGLIDKVIAENPAIDTTRLYLAGLSMGANGTWNIIANADPAIAGKFTAAVLMNGTTARLGGANYANAEERLAAARKMQMDAPYQNVQIPVWLEHSDTDGVVNVSGSRTAFAKLTGSVDTGSGLQLDPSVQASVSPLVETFRGKNINTGEEVHYTEYKFGKGDAMLDLGMVTPDAHFSWEASFKNQRMIDWLFDQSRRE